MTGAFLLQLYKVLLSKKLQTWDRLQSREIKLTCERPNVCP